MNAIGTQLPRPLTSDASPAGWVTAEEFAALPDTGAPRELVYGEVIDMAPPAPAHGRRQGRLTQRLLNYADSADVGTFYLETGFILFRNPDVVRLPDIAFLRKGREPRGEAENRFFDGAPDFVVEIRSPSESEASLRDKADEYLRAGTLLVWLINPDRRTLTVFRRGVPPLELGEAEPIDGGDVLPGFSCPVSELVS